MDDGVAFDAVSPDAFGLDVSAPDALTPDAADGSMCDMGSDLDAGSLCTEDHVGRTSSEGALVVDLQHNDLIAQPIRVTEDSELIGFGMIAARAEGAVYYTLHYDVNGEPGPVMNQGTSRVVLSASHLNFRSRACAATVCVRLVAGTRYWIVASIEAINAEVPAIYSFNDSSSSGPVRFGQATYPYLGDTQALTEASTGEVTLFVRVQSW